MEYEHKESIEYNKQEAIVKAILDIANDFHLAPGISVDIQQIARHVARSKETSWEARVDEGFSQVIIDREDMRSSPNFSTTYELVDNFKNAIVEKLKNTPEFNS